MRRDNSRIASIQHSAVGNTDVVTLTCGHVLHLAKDTALPGLSVSCKRCPRWVRMDDGTRALLDPLDLERYL